MSAEAETKVFDMDYDKPVTLTRWDARDYTHDQPSTDELVVRIRFALHDPEMAQSCETFDAAKRVVNNYHEAILSDFWIVSRDTRDNTFKWAEIYVGNTLWRVEPTSE